VHNGKYSPKKKCQRTGNGLDEENERENVREDMYNIQNRLENVTNRISQSKDISEHNELIWKL
jgi:hypothetical protein